MDELLVDPAVSRRKFDREVEQYRALESSHRARGWFLLKADFPTVEVLFAAAKVKPVTPLAFGVVLDFANYDLQPPSVRIVDPLSWVPIPLGELNTRLRIAQVREHVVLDPFGVEQRIPQPQPLMMGYAPDDIPFLCLPGVREYHSNPAHTADPWMVHRGKGEGTLHFILEKLHQFGVERIAGFGIQLVPQIVGLAFKMEGADDRVP